MEPETMRQPVAYLRRSRVDTRRPGTISHEQQLAAIRDHAAKHGDPDPLVIEDWGKSGRGERTRLREGFARLRAMVQAGEVSAVYAYDLSRLGRSLETVYALATECGKLGIPVRCASGYSPDVSTAEGRMVLGILGSIGEYFAESTKERAHVTVANRRARGDDLGPAPYGFRTVKGKHVPNPAEDVGAVVEAYRLAGSIPGACRVLNHPTDGIPTRKGGPWRPSTVAQVLDDNGARERSLRRGRPTSRTFLLGGLLRCPCGATLTGLLANKRTTVQYECKAARIDANHPRPGSVSEKQLMAWMRAEAARLRPPVDGVTIDAAEGDPDELAARRRRVIELYKSGLIEREERDADLAEIETQLRTIATRPTLAAIPSHINWDSPAEKVNDVLRSIWRYVQLGTDLRPVRAEPLLPPEWWRKPSRTSST